MIPFALAVSDAPGHPDDADEDADPDASFRPMPPEPDNAPPDPDAASETLPSPHDVAPPHPPESHAAPETSPDDAWAPLAAHRAATPPIAPPAAMPPRPTEPEPEPKRPPLQRAVLALLLIAAAGMIGYVLSTTNERPDEPDALARSVEAAGNLRLLLRTDVPAEARQFVREEFGWRVGVPLFEAASLTGVAIAQAAAAVEVPVFLYADEEDRNVAVFAYSYALLDQVPDRLRLTDDDYEALADGAPIVRGTASGDVLLWRDRDDIYVAVTDLSPDALTDGLSMDR